MRTLYSHTLLFLFFLLLAGYSAEAQNLIPNPGFEEGSGNNFTGWNVYNEISGTFSEGVAAGEFREGGRALKGEVTMAGEPWQLQLASDLIPTQVGESYTFTIWVKAAGAGTQIRFSTQPSALYSANYTVDTEWTQLEWVFTANEEMTRLVLDIGAEVNTYFLDDLYLEGPSGGGGSGGCQLVDNGGFETYDAAEGTFAGWSYANENGGSSFGLATGDNAYAGDNALQADNAGGIPRWGLQIATPAFPTVTGESYTLQIWIKAVVADANAIQFSTRDGNGQNEGQYTNSAGTIGGDWTQVSYTFTAIDDHTVITLNLGDETANTYYIDEVCVVYPEASDDCQLVDNGSFETYDAGGNTFAGWDFFNENGGSSFGLATGDNAYAGDNALAANNAGGIPRWGLQVGTPAFPTVTGQSYTLRIWIKAEVADANAIQFSTRDGNGENEGQYTNSAGTIGGDWTQVSYTFTAIDDHTVITLNLGDETANTYYIDEVCVVYPEASDNCQSVDNSSFETYDAGSNTFADWTYYNQGNGSTFGVTMDPDSVYSGANALVARTAANTQTFELQIASPSFYTLSGGTYRFKIWIKAATPDANTIQFSVRDAADPANTETQYTTSAGTIGGEWMQVTYEFTAPSARTLVTLNLGGATANTFYIDDVCVEVVCGTTYTAPADQEPIATGKEKFLGNVYAPHALPDFEKYFNQVTPENSAKWGSVEAQRDEFNWGPLDEARQFAKDNDFSFRFHVMVWGSQQPAWLEALPQAEQLAEVREWFEAVSTRYSGEDAPDYVEVVNEPLNAPPSYQDALTSLNEELGTEPGEYDWIVNSFKLARQYFPAETQLMINEYGTENTPGLNAQYVDIIQTLQADDLIDAIGIQGHTFSTRKYGGTYADLNNLLSTNLDNLAARGLPIIVTEMEIEGDMYFDENGEPQDGGTQAQKDSFQLAEYQRIFDLYWYHPSVVGITMWGWRSGLWQDAAEAYLIDPCTGQERPALRYLNTTIRGSNPMIDLPTDVAEIEPATSPVRVYPTLVDTELNIEGLPMGAGRIQILDLRGRVLKSIAYRTPGDLLTIDLTGLPAGLYIVQAGDVARKVVKR